MIKCLPNYLTTVCFAIVACLSIAQNLEVVSGPSYGRFWSRQDDGGYYQTDFNKPVFGYTLGIECSNLRIDSIINLRFGVQIENYGGDFYAHSGTHSNGVTDKGSLKKTVIGFSFFPLNLIPAGNWNISLGAQVNFLIDSKLSGTKEGWSGNGFTLTQFNDQLKDVDGFLANRNLALMLQNSYVFHWNKWVIEPRINVICGINPDMPGLAVAAYHFRIISAVGFGYSF